MIASFDAVISNDPGIDLHGLPLGLICVAVVDKATDDFGCAHIVPGSTTTTLSSFPTMRPRPRSMPAAHNARSSSPATAPAHIDKAVAGALRSWVDRRRNDILLEIPSRPLAEAWGDLHFARGVQKALRRHDRPTRVHLKPAWSSWAVARDDVRLQILGRAVAQARPGQVNALWQISHPDHARVEAYDREDVCFVASDR